MNDERGGGEGMRSVGVAVSVNVPLETIAWRAMHEEAKKRLAADRTLESGLLDLAEELQHLSGVLRGWPEGEAESGRKAVAAHIATLERVLTTVGMRIDAPVGAVYDLERMQFFENIAQRARFGLREPVIDEVVQPAIFFRGNLCRMGKAVIALPMDLAALGLGGS